MRITKNKFIETIAPLIVKEGKKRGYSVYSAVIAQAICESNWGQSQLSVLANNFFGLKCGSKWKGASINMKTKEEYKVGTLTTIKDNFRAYATVEDGVKGYYDFISTTRYNNLKTAITPLQYCQRLKADGYATSSDYVNTLMNIIDKNNLSIYDDIDITNIPTDIVQEVIEGKWGVGIDRKNRLTNAGYDYDTIQKEVNRRLRK